MQEVNDATFEAEVLKAEAPVVVDFWAPWCAPCHTVGAVLEELAVEHAGRVQFMKLNVEENPVTAARYDVLSLPSVILYAGGEPRATVIGARPRAHFEREFAAYLSPAG